MRIKFKPSAIDRVKTTGRRFDVRFTCQGARGILLRVGANGSKSWAYWQTIPNSRKVYFKTFRRVELDSHNRVKPVDLEIVLEWATKQRKAIREGISLKGAHRMATLERPMAENLELTHIVMVFGQLGCISDME